MTDTSGGAVIGAKVALRQRSERNAAATRETGSNGEYIFLEVPVGTYTIEAIRPASRNTCARA